MGSACGGEEEIDPDADTEDASGRGPAGVQDGYTLSKDGKKDQFAEDDSSSDSGKGGSGSDNDEEEEDDGKPYVFTVSDTTLAGYRKAVKDGNDSLVRFYIIEYPKDDFTRVMWPNGDSSLHVAAQHNGENCNVIEFLLNEGMSPNVVNTETKDTALHYAVKERATKLCELLIKFGADAQAMNKDYVTPIMVATELDYYELVHMLQKESVIMPKFKEEHSESGYSDDGSSAEESAEMDERLKLDLNAQKDKPESEHSEPENWKPKEYRDESVSESLETKLKKNMSADDVVQMKAMKVIRTNPFSKVKLGRSDTVGVQTRARKVAELPKMAAFLQKRTPRPPYVWNRRWAQVTETHFFWSEQMMSTNFKGPRPTIEELRRFKGHVRLDQVVSVEPAEKSKSGLHNKFLITMNAKSKRYSGERSIIWKCQTKEDRDFWVTGLKDYVTWYKRTDDYFG